MLNAVIELIRRNLASLGVIKHIYVFGSILDCNSIPNDIDILLIFDEYSYDVKQASNHLKYALESELEIPVDFTLLSVQEEHDVNFLSRIYWIRLK